MESQIRQRGYDPATSLICIKPRPVTTMSLSFVSRCCLHLKVTHLFRHVMSQNIIMHCQPCTYTCWNLALPDYFFPLIKPFTNVKISILKTTLRRVKPIVQSGDIFPINFHRLLCACRPTSDWGFWSPAEALLKILLVFTHAWIACTNVQTTDRRTGNDI